MTASDSDSLIRAAAFEQVRRLLATCHQLTHKDIAAGFIFGGVRVPLVNPQRGIFKPRGMKRLLSIRTVVPRAGGRVWYDDQRVAHRQIYEGEETIEYAFMGDDPRAPENQWLKAAMEERTPVIYFLGVAPGLYEALQPAFIVGWDAAGKTARVAFSEERSLSLEHQEFPSKPADRRYALRLVKQRLHQSSFRQAVIDAYRGRCALSGLPEPLLLDAAHIVSDGHELMGQPVIQNGIPLSKLHHAAFDAHLLGIDPDFRIHVAERLRVQRDGPVLEALKNLHGASLHLPRRPKDHPDRDRLAQRFEVFRKVA